MLAIRKSLLLSHVTRNPPSAAGVSQKKTTIVEKLWI